jgi:hypothetical protein
MDNVHCRPNAVITRGSLTARHYHQSKGADSIRIWCELDINGERYQPFNADFECSIGVAATPAAALISVEDGDERGLYLLRMTGAHPVLTRLSEDPGFDGHWTEDGGEYIYRGWAISLYTGERRRLPPYPGHFLCFSPDRQSLLSLSYEPPSPEVNFYQVDVESGAAERITVSRNNYPWVADSSHMVPGTLGSSHIWQAEHVHWYKSSDGHYKFSLNR